MGRQKVTKKRSFTPEYKKEVVEMIKQRGLSTAQAAQDLGLGKSTLESWLRKYRKANPEVPPLSIDEREELRVLRKENQTLKMERDFLKKTVAFFARSVV